MVVVIARLQDSDYFWSIPRDNMARLIRAGFVVWKDSEWQITASISHIINIGAGFPYVRG